MLCIYILLNYYVISLINKSFIFSTNKLISNKLFHVLKLIICDKYT